jgi:hypothetical protein
LTTPAFFRMTADADKTTAPALPVRLTRLLAAADVSLPASKVTVAALDRLLDGKGLNPGQRIDLKTALHRAGLLAG